MKVGSVRYYSGKNCKLFFASLLILIASHLFAEQDKLVIGIPPSVIEYNPLYTFSSTEAQLYTALYEGLVSYDPYLLRPIPAVAEKWEISADKKEFVFTLRSDAYYWDGVNVTAEIFRQSWLKMLDPEKNGEYAFLLDIITGAEGYRKGIIKDSSLVGIKKVGKYILKIELNTPAEHFLKILCHHSFVPVHPGFLDKTDWTTLPSAPGNGSYYILEKTDNAIFLEKNILYWDEKNVEIPSIEVRIIADPEEATALFNKGEIHWLTSSFIADNVDDRRSIIFTTSFATNYFFFNCREDSGIDENIRKLLLLSAPIEEIRNPRYIYFPAQSLVPTITDYPEISAFENNNKSEAEKLLKELKTPLPDKITIKIPQSFEGQRVATLLKESWEDFPGIPVEIKTYSYRTYYQELRKNDFSLGTISWIGDFPDPLTFLQMWTSSSNLNDSGYNNSLFDSAITESLSMSGKARYRFLAEAEQILLDSAAVFPISYSPSINLINLKIISGWYPNAIDIHPVKYFKFRQKKIDPRLAKADK